MEQLRDFNLILGVVMMVCFSYQFIYILAALFKKQKKYVAKKNHRFACIIAARNEGEVVSQLIESLKWQNYDKDLIDIFVVADNCTDNTAEVARSLGAIAYERFDNINKGKGYALNFLFENMYRDYPERDWEAFLFFDADNIVDENFVSEMNKLYDNGFKVATSYRNSKNFGDNWISSGYSLWFLKEAKFLNNPRMTFGTSAVVTGTGFMVASEIVKREGGWKYHSITEDTEFTYERLVEGEIIGYAEDAVIYDEQPTSFKQSIAQRSRWIKGSLFVIGKYLKEVTRCIAVKGSFSCFDMLMNSFPVFFFSCSGMVINIAIIILDFLTVGNLASTLMNAAAMFVGGYGSLVLLGGLVAISERKRIKAKASEIIRGVLTFPFFMMTYLIAMLKALFSDVTWEPIYHTRAKRPDLLKNVDKKIK
ncbi:MAG: glycosyltransferase [Ruminococcaceae bacterium]|nr:glycosyltransferase [Oscillospiraceae bacterium]